MDGHWGLDDEGTGILGPVGTVEEKRDAITTAADLYYPQWLERFETRGLTVHAALGDHELGDNPWKNSEAADFKRSAAELFRTSWAKYLTVVTTAPLATRTTPAASTRRPPTRSSSTRRFFSSPWTPSR